MKTTAKEAAAAGDTYYLTGKSCIKGHVSPRFASTRACVDCLAIAKAEYREKPENCAKELASSRQYKEQNREVLTEKRKSRSPEERGIVNGNTQRWRAKNMEKVLAYNAQYKKNNPARNTASTAAYNAAKLCATPVWADGAAIRAIYKEAAQVTAATGVPHEVDHEYPLRGKAVCGLHVHHNLRVIPATLNRRKYNKPPSDIAGYAQLVAERLKGVER